MPRPISASAVIQAAPDAIYRVIADYHDGHGRIVPRPPFVDLAVEEGGYGEGTRLRIRMKAFGGVRSFRAHVTEPEPGRTLVETNDTGWVTTFTVDPFDHGRSARVTIASELKTAGPLRATLEHVLAGRMLRRTFDRELERLADVAEAAAGVEE